MKYSPISDWGRDWQNTSEWNWPKPFWLTPTVITPCSRFWQWASDSYWQSSIFLIDPPGTPATLKSDPTTRPNVLSTSILYVVPELVLLLDAPRVTARNAPTRTTTAAPTRIRLICPSVPGRGYTGTPTRYRRANETDP